MMAAENPETLEPQTVDSSSEGSNPSAGRTEIDTSAPFESVKEAANRFGGMGFWKPTSRRPSELAPEDVPQILKDMARTRSTITAANYALQTQQIARDEAHARGECSPPQPTPFPASSDHASDSDDTQIAKIEKRITLLKRRKEKRARAKAAEEQRLAEERVVEAKRLAEEKAEAEAAALAETMRLAEEAKQAVAAAEARAQELAHAAAAKKQALEEAAAAQQLKDNVAQAAHQNRLDERSAADLNDKEDGPLVKKPNVLRFTTKYTGEGRVQDLPWTKLGNIETNRKNFRRKHKSNVSATTVPGLPPTASTPADNVPLTELVPDYLTSPARLLSEMALAIEHHDISNRHLKAIYARISQASRQGGATSGIYETPQEYERAISNLEKTLTVFKAHRAVLVKTLSSKDKKAKNVVDESEEEFGDRAQKKRKGRVEPADDENDELSEAEALKLTRKRSRKEKSQATDDLVQDGADNVKKVSELRREEQSKGAGSSSIVKPLRTIIPDEWPETAGLPPIVNLMQSVSSEERHASPAKQPSSGVGKSFKHSSLTPFSGTKPTSSRSQDKPSPAKIPASNVARPPPKGSRKKIMVQRTVKKSAQKRSKSQLHLQDEDDEMVRFSTSSDDVGSSHESEEERS